MIEEFPFPIQRIQSDRGTEFFGASFQGKLRECDIKFRPIRPGSPHLNGKVERSQQTDLLEFYALEDLSDPELEEHLFEWQHFYNWHRPRSSLGGQTRWIDSAIFLEARHGAGKCMTNMPRQKRGFEKGTTTLI
jgi:transposase InsO family protein